jgi:hypothetical protein
MYNVLEKLKGIEAAKKVATASQGVKQQVVQDIPVAPAAIFAALAATGGPTDAFTIASRFRRTRNLEGAISSVLASLARLGHVVTKDGKTFDIQRAA